MKKVASLLCLVLWLFCMATRSQIVDEQKDVRLENLNRSVVELRKAYGDADILKITALFNQQDIESVGGSERFADFVGLGRSAAPETFAKFGSPTKLDSSDGKWFGVISFRMETLVEKGRRLVQTYLVGISTDDGKTWRFKTGESFFKDYPELVGTVEIPERTDTVID